MHIFYLAIISSLSIGIPAITGVIRLKLIPRDYFPLLLLFWIGMVNEILSVVMMNNVKNTWVNSNVYVLMEYLLLLLQFYKWHTISLPKMSWFMAAGITVWITDNVLLHSIRDHNSIFRMAYAFTIMYLCTQQIAKTIVDERSKLSRNSIFLFCITFLLFFGIKMYIESFNMIHLAVNKEFYSNLWMIMLIVNLFANILYTIAIVCIRSKQAFTYPPWYQ